MSTLAQLDAIRYDLDGGGWTGGNFPVYTAAFTNTVSGMGCPSTGCRGYELTADLDFDTNGNGRADSDDDYWNDGAGWVPLGLGDDGAATLGSSTATATPFPTCSSTAAGPTLGCSARLIAPATSITSACSTSTLPAANIQRPLWAMQIVIR